MKYKFCIFCVILSILFLCYCSSSPSNSEIEDLQTRLDSFIEANHLDWEELEMLHSSIDNEGFYSRYDSTFFEAYKEGKIEKSNLVAMDRVLDAIYVNTEHGFDGPLVVALANEYRSNFSDYNLSHSDLETIYFSGDRRKEYFELNGHKYFPDADNFLKKDFRKRLKSLNLESPRPLIDSILANRLPEKLAFKDTLVDVEIKTKGIETFNVPYFNGYQLALEK